MCMHGILWRKQLVEKKQAEPILSNKMKVKKESRVVRWSTSLHAGRLGMDMYMSYTTHAEDIE